MDSRSGAMESGAQRRSVGIVKWTLPLRLERCSGIEVERSGAIIQSNVAQGLGNQGVAVSIEFSRNGLSAPMEVNPRSTEGTASE